MFKRKLTAVALALVATGVLAGTANAAVVDTDPVQLLSDGYDFGDSTFSGTGPTGYGSLAFEYTGGQIKPHLTGTLHLDGVKDTCARMRMESFDGAGKMLDKSFGGTVCADDDDYQPYTVDLAPYADPSIDYVEVALEKETATGWIITRHADYFVDTHDDDVKITEPGVDFGGSTFGTSTPDGPGNMEWTLKSGLVTPHLTGTIWLDRSATVCARIHLRYLTESGAFLAQRAGGDKCAPDNGLAHASVDLSPYSSNEIGKVEVELQTEATDGTWNTAGSKTVSIAE
jgi:hypothetical protein